MVLSVRVNEENHDPHVPPKGTTSVIPHKHPLDYETSTKSMKKSESDVAQLCPTLCDPMDCSLLGSFIHGIFQARIMEWAAISFSRESSQPRDRTQVSHIAGGLSTI